MTLFSCRLVTSPTFRRRLSGVLSKFSHNFFSLGWHSLDGVTRGGPPSPSDATASNDETLYQLNIISKPRFLITHPRFPSCLYTALYEVYMVIN